jgi:hypothetical protein
MLLHAGQVPPHGQIVQMLQACLHIQHAACTGAAVLDPWAMRAVHAHVMQDSWPKHAEHADVAEPTYITISTLHAPVLQAGDTLSRNTYRNGSLLRDIEAADARGMYTSFCG